ncbi:hypothetical protein GALMADRAFT_255985 [Galerina marginata CBS 339.88]|uniref:Uncharacterized protein n=1 Tax=Galerina marginata (strain CBS 339.88) TaxID=685588 RepID=A0A067SHM2_GALM3|nr:hypothetical protein GALMADRAFT_255985 [Galerina marginata CBS 339.88]
MPVLLRVVTGFRASHTQHIAESIAWRRRDYDYNLYSPKFVAVLVQVGLWILRGDVCDEIVREDDCPGTREYPVFTTSSWWK